MPRHVWPLWVLTILSILGLPVVSFLYYPLLSRFGDLPVDGDSIGIPMFGSLFMAISLSPLIFLIAYFCLYRYNPQTRLTAWRRDRLFISLVATTIFGGAAGFLAVDVVRGFLQYWPWYEYLWTVYSCLLIMWLLALRAALVDYVGD